MIEKSIPCMNDLTEMAAARLTAGVSGRGLRKYQMLLLVILGALLHSIGGGGSVLASSSPSLLAVDINQLAQPSYLAFSDGGSRHLLVISSDTSNATHPLLLATSRTDRPNPKNKLKTYTGGYNLSSIDYGASLAYTGLAAWILTLLWAGLGLILLLTLCLICCCCLHRTKHEYTHGRLGYILPIIALIIFTLAAIAGSVLLYYAQVKFHVELTETLNYVVDEAESTEAGLRQVQTNLTLATNFNTTDQAQIAALNVQLNNTANDLHNKTVDNRKRIKYGIDILRVVFMAVAGVMLALVLLGLLFSALGIRSIVYLLVLVGWVLVLGTWILSGIFILIDNGIGDTCLSMKEWADHPQANTSLDMWLPCDGAAAASALNISESYTGQLVSGINDAIKTPINLTPPPSMKLIWYNQSGPLVPSLCYNTSPCPNNTVSLADASTVWKGYECAVKAGNCITQGRLTPSNYTQLTTLVGDALSFTSSATFLEDTANCKFVRDVFVDIHDNRCHDLRLHTKWIWIGLILVSAGTMLSILLWIVFIRRKRYRYKGKGEGK